MKRLTDEAQDTIEVYNNSITRSGAAKQMRAEESIEEPLASSEASHSRPESPPGDSQQPCLLEQLPPELRRYLLNSLDFPCLKALVHASPTFHAQYSTGREFLLLDNLRQNVGSAIVEAYAVQQSSSHRNPTREQGLASIKEYRANLSHRCLPPHIKITVEETIAMTKFYHQTVKPLVDVFIHHTWGSFFAGTDAAKHPQVSQTEKIRFTRAVYRLQILCQNINVAGRGGEPVDNLDDEVVLQALVEALQPWEVEEMIAFIEYVTIVYEDDLAEVREDMDPRSASFVAQEWPHPMPIQAFGTEEEEGDHWCWECWAEGLTLRGLPLLKQIIFDTNDHDQLLSTVKKYLLWSQIGVKSPDGYFNEGSQIARREVTPTRHDRKQEAREPMVFRGDGEPDAPPRAWTLMWAETYSNLYGWFVTEGFRDWGYVFWDAKTLQEGGACKQLQSWQGACSCCDPRKDLAPLWLER